MTGTKKTEKTINVAPPIATLREARRRAKRLVPPQSWDWLESGTEREWSRYANLNAFAEYMPVQRVFRNVSNIRTKCDFLGASLPMPLIGSPLGGLTQYHQRGEVALLEGCGLAGSVATISAMARLKIEDARQASPDAHLIYQLYFQGPEEWIASEIERAHKVGAMAICLCGDAPVRTMRYRDRENRYDARKFGARENAPPPDHALGTRSDWQLVKWVRTQTDKPLLIKGVMCEEDAEQCLAHGADGIWVSNHGGRAIDAGIASLEVLPEIRAAVGQDTLVLFDGGVRTGTDVLRAIALGADIVAVGRPLVYGLAIDGAAGVQRVFELYREEFASAMAMCGVTSPDAIGPDILKVRRSPKKNLELAKRAQAD